MNETHVLERIAGATRTILESINLEYVDRDGLKDTPRRFAGAFAKFTEGYAFTPEEVVGDAIFGDCHDEIVLVRDIPIYSLCEHHLIPFFGKAHVAYIPDPKKGIIGLSKFNRITEVFARRLQVQERLTRQIMDALHSILQPKGVGVIIECRHMCMEMRGVESPSTTVTKTTCGVFDDPDISREFVALALRRMVDQDDIFSNSRACNGLGSTNERCCPPRLLCLDSKQLEPARIAASNDAHDYRLYQRIAKFEPESIAKFIKGAMVGPLSERKSGFSILDIGAGNGNLFQAICSCFGRENIAHYTAFEQEGSLADELLCKCKSILHEDNLSIQAESFLPSTVTEAADIVLLSHSLYGCENKETLIERALHFVAPGGVMFIFHRWTSGGTLDRLSEYLNSQSLIHQFATWDIKLDVSKLDSNELLQMSRYTKGDVRVKHGTQSIPSIRTIGCIAIEPHSCQLGNLRKLEGALATARQQVSYLARKKVPRAVVAPTTATGIQACLRAASLHLIGNGSISVIGGGHSASCLDNNAIAVNMCNWNHVEVDPDSLLVRVGGGATIGAVTKECEKFNLAVPLGDRPGVGIGLVLQGGLNHFMRCFGLACDQIVQVLYINPHGKLEVAEEKEDLFRFRGVGPNFGVVLELTLKTAVHPGSVLTGQNQVLSIMKQDTEYVLSDGDRCSQTATSYSLIAEKLPDTACLDGFIFWSSYDNMSFATSLFDLNASGELGRISLPYQHHSEVISHEAEWLTPSGLFDRELYMTPTFDAERVLAPDSLPPRKLRSQKRCILLPPLDEVHGSILFGAIKEAPTKHCYIHFLHGGGAVSRIPSAGTAFGHRKWSFAAVITGRWPDSNEGTEVAVTTWLNRTTARLLPHSIGVYGSDLGPSDQNLALFAFGENSLRLAEMKRKQDPLNVLRCGCPLLGDEAVPSDPRVQSRGVVIIFCGRRHTGKDWLARVAQH
eukprot:CAMPEP_0113529340 /NCGR_PEP_ID=MMETSP0015_2-20120614/2340_1 /TAXON_ID=2838 /ORGANISM="Odontella" /LENGTH=956 /DNA_ID=CAMNT_0000427961 /DNA_START=356 /DNA_END=3223 /DNA_ORIENTATION=- /assembly_acc=CAM_ASM_000160